MTEKCYYHDINRLEFEAGVVSISKEKKGWRVILDKTCFFPEGGGQPADRGRINDIAVTDVKKEGDDIFHYLSENPGSGVIKGKIDPEWRRDFMQQHTGQHIISAALWKTGKYKTVAVHMGLDYTTIEIETPEIPEKDLIKTEKLANRVINDNLPLSFIEIDHRELDKFELRKPTDLTGLIRLVRIGDFDCVACSGLHFESTGPVGLVKATGNEKIRGNTRITWKIGARAYADYRKKDRIISGLKTVLSTNEDMFIGKTRELQEEILSCKRENNSITSRLAVTMAQDLYEKQPVQGKLSLRIISESRQEEDGDIIKKVMKELLKRENVLICLVNVLTDKLQWCIGCSRDVDFSFDDIGNELLAVIDGKGGGRFPLWQGTGKKPEQAENFLSVFRALTLKLA